MEEVINAILIREVETKNIMTKSSLPLGGYSVNPYVGCTHACKYCYASFMKRFTGHKEEWGTFLDVKHWPEIKNPKKYVGQRVVIGSVTDGYNPQEEQFGKTRKLLEQLIGSDADILICTKSDLVAVSYTHLFGRARTENHSGRDKQVPAVKDCRFTQTAFGTVVYLSLIHIFRT